MRQQLESMMDSYQTIVSEQRQTTYFVVGDLESLSASALYSGKISGSSSGGASWVRSTDYVKSIPQGKLHVHAPEGIVTGANLNGEPISNYEAAMLDLQRGKVHKNTGNF